MNFLSKWLAKRVWPIGVVMVVFVAMSALRVRDRRQFERATIVAVEAATAFTRDSVATDTRIILDSASREIQRAEGELAAAKRASDRAQHIATVRAQSNAATDRLYASLRALSDSARADSAVRAVERASVAVATENDTLKQELTTVALTAVQERVAADALHAADTAAIRGLAGTLGGVRDSLAVEARRPKRTKKSTFAAALSGAAFTAAVHVAWQLLKTRERLP